ncbi:MAG: late competence development ComFB family protein [Treponema sp.]|nr:late competence development ComFB family protein [Treponema sp.]
MKVHNIMEEYVATRVENIYNRLTEDAIAWLTCDCDICRHDVVGYVLNRIPPRYVVSSRGSTHGAQAFTDAQLSADVDALVMHGIRLINAIQRPYHTPYQRIHEKEKNHITPVFNFPVFQGTVYDGLSFDCLADVQLTLMQEDNTVALMVDTTWENPCRTYKATNGSYSFWVRPFAAGNAHSNATFHFTIEAVCDGYRPVFYGFAIPLVSEESKRLTMDASSALKLPDFFLFPDDKDTEE